MLEADQESTASIPTTLASDSNRDSGGGSGGKGSGSGGNSRDEINGNGDKLTASDRVTAPAFTPISPPRRAIHLSSHLALNLGLHCHLQLLLAHQPHAEPPLRSTSDSMSDIVSDTGLVLGVGAVQLPGRRELQEAVLVRPLQQSVQAAAGLSGGLGMSRVALPAPGRRLAVVATALSVTLHQARVSFNGLPRLDARNGSVIRFRCTIYCIFWPWGGPDTRNTWMAAVMCDAECATDVWTPLTAEYRIGSISLSDSRRALLRVK